VVERVDQPEAGDGQVRAQWGGGEARKTKEAGVMLVEERGLSSRQRLKVERGRRLGDLSTPSSVQKLQTALHVKAKAEPEYRYYALYDKVYRMDVLAFAYHRCRANKGAAGVDGQTFDDIEAYGREQWLGELAQQLKEGKYRPEAVRRVYIPKPNGKLRPLGISCLRDRVCMMAGVLVLGPIFEADLPPEQHAYRQGKNALSAVKEVDRLLHNGHREVVDADLSGYFDGIPHCELMKSVARRVVDRRMMHLLKMWLESPVEETDKRGRKTQTTPNRDCKRGTPQGSPISPLLANIYMRRFILGWKKRGLEATLGAKIVNYADDLVICCKRGADEALMQLRQLMGHLKLEVNEEKTRTCRMPEESFDFLGYTFGRTYSPKTGKAYVSMRPSKKSIKRLIDKVGVQTERRMLLLDAAQMVEELNWMLTGWANYFCLGPVSKAYQAIDAYTTARLRRWLCKKHQKGTGGYTCYPDDYLYQQLGLVCLPTLTQRLPWAKT
jgi:group II intron reverse transcriptase/maturase